ncbi:uncharacterized protein LOC134715808 isoform X1 [Mytilus trossulus]|uniref:uncharacterized protein LOC134715808 isoform X1 n=2 Tax=Mytilus trossulus TaxID=6551 RepID=UPI003006BA4A
MKYPNYGSASACGSREKNYTGLGDKCLLCSEYFCCHDNMLWQNLDGRMTSPRPQSRRSKSSREIYHPAIKDLSEQAGLTAQSLCVEEVGQTSPPYYVNGDASVTSSHDCASNGHDLTIIPPEPARLSTASPFCNSKKLPALYENSYSSYRQRVVMSGIRLKLLNTSRRPHSTEPTGIIAPSIPYSCANDPNGNVSFIIKNTNSQIEDQEPKEKRKIPHYNNKTRFKSHSGTLLSDGNQVHMNVFHQHLVNIHPLKRQETSLWLSNGFKVQSFKSKGKRSQTYIKPNTAEGHFRNRRSANGKLCREFSSLHLKPEVERQRELEMVLNDSLKQSTDLGDVTISPLQIQGGLTGPSRLAADFNLQKG